MNCFSLALLAAVVSVVASSTHAAAVATLEECRQGDLWCLERNHQLACTDPSSATVESCMLWLERLHQQADGSAKEIYLKIGQVNEALAFHAKDPKLAQQYRERAAKTYREMIVRDQSDAAAIVALANLTENRRERLRLLRRGVALAPHEISALQLLASELVLTGRTTDKLEAAQYMERAYLAQTGPNKWYLASMAHRIYLDAGAEDAATKFLQRVLDDFGVEEFSPASMSRSPDDLSQDLTTLCNYLAVPVVGVGKCLNSIDVTTEFLLSSEPNAELQQLADATAKAMHSVTGAESQLTSERPEWLKTFHEQLESLLSRGYGSASVYLVYGWLTTGDKRLDAVQKAVALDPNNGQAAFTLGEEYSLRKMWNQALNEYRRATTLLPAWQQQLLKEQIEVAEDMLRESAKAKP